jgi:lysophospholipase L1-like esterase
MRRILTILGLMLSSAASAQLDTSKIISNINGKLQQGTMRIVNDFAIPVFGRWSSDTSSKVPGLIKVIGNSFTYVGVDRSYHDVLTSETDPAFLSSVAHSINNTNLSNWNDAFGWGNHASAGYLTSSSLTPYLTSSIASSTYQPVGSYATTSQVTAKLDTSNFNETYTGTLYNKQSWDDISDFTNSGTTVSVVSNKLSFTAGANDFNQKLYLNGYSLLDKWRLTVGFSIGAKTSTTYGFGIGKDGNPITVKFDASTGANSGLILVYSNSTLIAQSVTALTFSSGDSIVLSLEQDGNIFTSSARNYTTNSADITASYTYVTSGTSGALMPNTGRFFIASFGGAFTVYSIKKTSRVIKNAAVALFGDSKFQHYSVSSNSDRIGDILGRYYGSSITFAGQSDTTGRLLLALPGLISLRPKIVLLEMGSNDNRFGIPIASTKANITSIVSQLQSAGTTVKILTPSYESAGLNQQPLNDWEVSTFPSLIIDNYAVTKKCGDCLASDGIHPNLKGNTVKANNIIESLTIPAGKAVGSTAAVGAIPGPLTITDGASTIYAGSNGFSNYGALQFGGTALDPTTQNIGGNGTDLYLNRRSGSSIYFGENGTNNQMRLFSGGSLGLGSQTMSGTGIYKLWVYGNSLTTGNSYLDGNVQINSSNSGGNTLDIWSGQYNGIGALKVGGNVNSWTRNPNTRKIANIVSPNYTDTGNTGTSVQIFSADNDGTNNTLNFGGTPSGSNYTSTVQNFLTASNTTTLGGTVRMKINSVGVSIGTTGAARLPFEAGKGSFSDSLLTTTLKNSGVSSFSDSVLVNKFINLQSGVFTNGGGLLMAADLGAFTRTANTRKLFIASSASYAGAGTGTNNYVFVIDNSSTANKIEYGGTPGGALNAVTYQGFVVGATQSTTGGTTMENITTTGVSIGNGATAANSKAILDIASTTQGILLPRMTKTQRDAISSPPTGLMVYQTDNTPGLRVYNGTNWMRYTETAD